MSDRQGERWSLWRFALRAIPWTVASGFVWKFTAHYNADFTVTVTKFLHRLALHPAPYLFADDTTLFWHATMFPPVVGFGLASYWLSWPGRILRTLVGYLAYCCLTSVAITINESPYLQQTEMLNATTSTVVNANYLMFGVVIWVLSSGHWYERQTPTAARPNRKTQNWIKRMVVVVRYGWATRLVCLVLGASLVVPMFAMTGSSESRAARADVARAMRAVPYFPQPSLANVVVDESEQRERERLAAEALLAIEKAIQVDIEDKQPSASMYYLAGHILLSLRPNDVETQKQFQQQALLALRQAKKSRGR